MHGAWRKNSNGDYDCALHGRTDNRVEEKKMIKLENTEVFGWKYSLISLGLKIA